MAQHIVLMNLVAPLVALLLRQRIGPVSGRFLALATLAQLVLIWGWHAPPVMMGFGHSAIGHALMLGTLFGASLAFWVTVFGMVGARTWQPVLALLVTSKLFCLLGALMLLAPRQLFMPTGHQGHVMTSGLGDQQLAGMMMLMACPATYVLAGIWLAARWFTDLERDGAAGHTGEPVLPQGGGATHASAHG